MNIRFGVSIEAPVEWDELLAVAREIDRNTDYDVLWISDALYTNSPGDPYRPRLDAWTALAAIAQATSRVRLGVLVSANPLREPAVLAKIATTVDHISGGRLEFGIGAGWPGENRRFGIHFAKRRERYERLAEALTVIKLLWTQEQPQFEGSYFRLDAPDFRPSTVQRPHPPITVGLAGSTHAALVDVVAKHADKAEASLEAFPLIDARCRELGRAPSGVARTTETMFFLHDDPAVLRRAMDYAISQYGGTEDDVRRRAIWGTAEEAKALIQARIDSGYSEIYLFQLPRLHLKSLIRFSDEIIPSFR